MRGSGRRRSWKNHILKIKNPTTNLHSHQSIYNFYFEWEKGSLMTISEIWNYQNNQNSSKNEMEQSIVLGAHITEPNTGEDNVLRSSRGVLSSNSMITWSENSPLIILTETS